MWQYPQTWGWVGPLLQANTTLNITWRCVKYYIVLNAEMGGELKVDFLDIAFQAPKQVITPHKMCLGVSKGMHPARHSDVHKGMLHERHLGVSKGMLPVRHIGVSKGMLPVRHLGESKGKLPVRHVCTPCTCIYTLCKGMLPVRHIGISKGMLPVRYLG